MKWWNKLRPVAEELIILALVLAAVLAANIGHAATGSAGSQGMA
jgi:hypothetical protein